MNKLLFFERMYKEPYFIDNLFDTNWLMIAIDTDIACFERMLEFEDPYKWIKSILHRNHKGHTIFDLVDAKETKYDYRSDSTRKNERRLCEIAFSEMSSDNVNSIINKNNDTLLLFALKCDNIKVASKLLDIKECNAIHRDCIGHNILTYIVRWFNKWFVCDTLTPDMMDVLRKLFQSNYDINTCTIDKTNTLLSIVLDFDNNPLINVQRCEILELLLKRPDCDVMMKPLGCAIVSNVYNKLISFISSGHKVQHMIKILIEHKNFDVNYTLIEDEDTILIRAAFCENYDLVLDLLDNKKCDINQKNCHGMTAIDYIIQGTFKKGLNNIAIRLLEKLLTFNEFDINGKLNFPAFYNTILTYSISIDAKMYDVTNFLLDQPKCKLNQKFKTYFNAIGRVILSAQYANADANADARAKLESLLRKLIERKDFDVTCTIVTECNEDILTYAERNNMSHIIVMCLNNHINDKTPDGITLIEYAINKLSPNMVVRILSHPAFSPDPTYGIAAIEKGIKNKYSTFFSRNIRKRLLDVLKKEKITLTPFTRNIDIKSISPKTSECELNQVKSKDQVTDSDDPKNIAPLTQIMEDADADADKDENNSLIGSKKDK